MIWKHKTGAYILESSTGSTWEYGSASGKYHLRLFDKDQPDLNWEYPPVRVAVDNIIRSWLDKGVDGFRYVLSLSIPVHWMLANFFWDGRHQLYKMDGLSDAEVTISSAKYQHGAGHHACGPRMHEHLKDVGKILTLYSSAFSVSEMLVVKNPKEVIKSVGGTTFRDELGMANMPESWDISEYCDLKTLNHWKELRETVAPNETILETTRKEYHLKSRGHARPKSRTQRQVSQLVTPGSE
ncbi:hypothetical protein B0T10DRAFT_594982 [Thelonectria olida]|uniref:Glycosyl hydrolase family 13 catalytic domain-containing protein n=1 Tax=Thelonectria olida TaxID=1576542 RepID=A0A9P8VQY7_9HYPO|nr:hypothetical protein B0T10DRAFT_594982 [Thelonectria olida]